MYRQYKETATLESSKPLNGAQGSKIETDKGAFDGSIASYNQNFKIKNKQISMIPEISNKLHRASDGNSNSVIEIDSLGNAESRLNEYILLGGATLERLRDQRQMMKGTHRRLLDATNQLSIGRTIMRAITRRSSEDRWIFYVGVFVVFLVIYFCYKYVI